MRVDSEVDLGVTVTRNLSSNQHIKIGSKTNKMLGILRRTCPLLTNHDARRTLYILLGKFQLCYATEVWSPSQSTYKTDLERIQRRATRWILRLKMGDISYKDRLLALNLLLLAYDGQIKDLTSFFKALRGHYDLNVFDYVSSVSHARTDNCSNPSLMLKVPSCKTSTFQSSFFNRIVLFWSLVCRTAQLSDLRSLTIFRSFLSRTYLDLLISCYGVDLTCTWSLYRTCSRQ